MWLKTDKCFSVYTGTEDTVPSWHVYFSLISVDDSELILRVPTSEEEFGFLSDRDFFFGIAVNSMVL